MRKIILTAVALSPLFGGVAMAECAVAPGAGPGGQPSKCTLGPMAYPDWQAQWAQVRNTPAAQLLGVSQGQTPAGAAQGASQPNG